MKTCRIICHFQIFQKSLFRQNGAYGYIALTQWVIQLNIAVSHMKRGINTFNNLACHNSCSLKVQDDSHVTPFHLWNLEGLYSVIKVPCTLIQSLSPCLTLTRLFVITKRVTLVYLYHVNRCGHHKKLSIAKLDFVQVCGLSLKFYNNTLRKFYKFSDSRETWSWTSPTLQSTDWTISRQYHWPRVCKRVSYPEV